MGTFNDDCTSASQIELICHADFNIPVGEGVSLFFPGINSRLKTMFVGVNKNKYLITHLPEKAKLRTVTLDSEVTGRFVHGTLVCGFNTTVAGTVSSPFPLLFLHYPECFEILNMRSDDRVTCFVPATLLWENQALQGRIIDISKGGCKIVTDPTASNKLPSVNVKAEIICTLLHDDSKDETRIKTKVRRIIAEENKLIVSCEFPDLPEDIELIIGEFVDRIMGYL